MLNDIHIIGYVMLGLIGLGGLFMFVFCFGSLIYLVVRAIKAKVEER